MGKAQKIVKRKKGEEAWTEISFERSGGFKTPKFSEPTLKSSKYAVALYRTNLIDGQHVRLFANGEQIAIMQDEKGAKKLKANKANTKVSISGKNVVRELGLKSGDTLPGQLGEVGGKEAWIFQAKV